MTKQYSVAIVGVGAVGNTLLEVLAERRFPVGGLKVLATSRSAGKSVQFGDKELVVEETTAESFRGIDIALFAGGEASKLFARHAVNQGAVVIDNSSTFRMDPDVPLIVPEVNPEDLRSHKGIIANPNCSTILMVVVLKPLHDAAGLRRVVVATYQAVSGAGQEAMDELINQTKEVLTGGTPYPAAFPHPIAFNLIPHIDVFQENGYTKEEMKMVLETRKMLHQPELPVSATTVRVPVLRSHSEAVWVETEAPLGPDEARAALDRAPGVIVVDDPSRKVYPMPIEAAYRDEVFVGRVRRDISCKNGLALWLTGDQLRKGAATNAIQIAELLITSNTM